MKRILVLGIFSCLVSCLADVADPSVMDDTAETQDAVTVADPTPEEVKASLTGWVAHLSGTDLVPCQWGVIGVDCRLAKMYPDDPRQADEMGHVVLVKNGNQDPKGQITFSLARAWMKGDAYIAELVTQHTLTPLDLVGILGALQRLERPPPLPPAPSAHAIRLDCYECGDPPAPWGPISDPNDHRGGPSGGGKPKPPPPTVKPQPQPPPRGAGNTGRPGSQTADPGYLKRLQEMENGIEKGDPHPTPSPFDAGFWPGFQDHREDFKCEGHVYNGFKHACPDFMEKREVTKVSSKIGDYFRRNEAAYRAYVFHHLWSDGRKPECTRTCQWFSNTECYGLGVSAAAICAGLTGGACATTVAGALGILAGGGLVATCVDTIRNYCDDNICLN